MDSLRLDRIVERTLDSARLRGAQRDRVARELRAHLEDALGDGRSIEEIAADFGDPALVGALLRSHPPMVRSRASDAAIRVAVTAAAVASLVIGLTYASTAARLETFRQSSAPNAWLDTLAGIAQTRQYVLADLRGANGETKRALVAIHDAVASASELAHDVDVFSQAVAAQISMDVLDASSILASSDLSESERLQLARELRMLRSTQVALDSTRENQWIAHIVRRSFDKRQRPTAQSLRIAQAMKGVRESTMRARLLEPVFFANTRSARRRWIAMVATHFASARRAQSRFRSRYASTLARIETARAHE
jgi:hypothetical protein